MCCWHLIFRETWHWNKCSKGRDLVGDNVNSFSSNDQSHIQCANPNWRKKYRERQMLAENRNGVLRRLQWGAAIYSYNKYLIWDSYWLHARTVTSLTHGQLLASRMDSYWLYARTVTGFMYGQLLASRMDSYWLHVRTFTLHVSLNILFIILN
jgi:hypothetical protein